MMIELAHIAPDPANARRIVPTLDQEAALKTSLTALGQLQPILVRPHLTKDRYVLVDGERRYRAALALGWHEIEATVKDGLHDTVAASAAANMVRAAMNPVDQWRAICALQDGGMTLELAAQALGVTEALARRMTKLGFLHPDVLDAIAKHGMPSADHMAVIAMAPQDVQAKAIEKRNWMKPAKGQEARPDWWAVGRACTMRRIPRARAIFDTNLADVTFEEDLFAEPGTDEQFTTIDVAGFMAAQTAALKAIAERSKHIQIIDYDANGPKVPKGLRIDRHSEMDLSKPIKNPGAGRKILVAVVPENSYHAGSVSVMIASEIKTPATGKSKEQAPGRADDAPKAKPPIDKKGLEQLAEMKRQFLAKAFDPAGIENRMDADDLIKHLILALGASNVHVGGTTSYDMESLAAKAFAARNDKLLAVAAEAVGRILVVPHGNGFGSGAALSWVARLINDPDPRFDTPDFLDHVSYDTLVLLARAQNIEPPKSPAKLRAALVGKLPDWTPPGWFDGSEPKIDEGRLEEDENSDSGIAEAAD